MTEINFPSSPALNEVYTFCGRSWVWNGSGWVISTYSLSIKDEGIVVSSGVTSIDFVGSSVVASGAGGAVTVTISGGSGGSGDMLAATYDPQAVEGDAFDTDNHTDGLVNGVYTLDERSKLAGIEEGANAYVHPNHSGDVTSVGDGAQALVEWSAGNVIYVPLNGDIQDYIDAATAGDTLLLASGEYVITASITVDKELNIMGQGNAGFYTIPSAPAHGTVISSVTASVMAFNVTSDNVRIAHLSINLSGAASTGIGTANNLTGLVLTNIDVIVTCTGLAQGFMIQGTNAVLRNLTFYITSTNGSCSGLYVYNINSTTADKIVDCFTVTGTTKGASGDNWSFLAENNNCSKKITLNLSNSVCKALAGTAADIAVAAISATTNNAVVNCYLCELSGEDYDVYQEGDGGDNELNVGGSVLVNNLVYGTVTYRAAMAAGVGVFGTSVETPAIKITTGAGAGKVLTSDADGDATWEAGGGGAWDGDIADIDLDGGTDIGAALADADLILVDDGAGGTNRKAAMSRVKTYIGNTYPILYDSGILGADAANMDTGAIIPATYINLRVCLSVRTDTANTYDFLNMIINNDTGSNYDYMMPRFYHNGQYATSEELGVAYMLVGFPTAANSVAGDFAKITIDILDYANANVTKDFLGYSQWRGSAASGNLRLYNCAGHWRSTAAISRIAVAPLTAGKKWKQYSRMVVYGY